MKCICCSSNLGECTKVWTEKLLQGYVPRCLYPDDGQRCKWLGPNIPM